MLRLPPTQRTYSNAAYVLTAMPLGLVCLVVLLASLIPDLLLLAVRVLAAGLWVSLREAAPLLSNAVRRLPVRRRPHATPPRLHDLASGGGGGRRGPIGAAVWLYAPALVWRLAAYERGLVTRLLGVELPPMPVAPSPALGRRACFHAYLRERLTGNTVAYLLLKLPLGALAPGVAYLSVATAAALVANPSNLNVLALTSPILAFAALVLGLHAVNGLARGSGALARRMLGSDETARRLAEAEEQAARERLNAERAEQARRRLMVNVGHELRTPVASIRGHVESLLLAAGKPAAPGTQAVPSADLERYLGIVHRETERLTALVDELLALARSEAGELRLEIEPVAAREVIDQVYETLAPLAKRERAVTLVREVTAGLPPVLADRQRLEQVLLNLVRNAVTHTPRGGVVWLELRAAGEDRVALSVTDTGAGIAADDLPRVWERFYRADESRSRETGGTGLGLAIVRDLVVAMGGAVSARSTVGEGSTFQVLLRVMRDE